MDTPFCSFFSYAPLGSENGACKLIIVPEPFLLGSFSFAWLPPLPSNSSRAVVVVVQWRRWRATERVYKNTCMQQSYGRG